MEQPNRPAFRMTETTFTEIEALTKSMFLDGIIQGMPVAKNVGYFVDQAVMFGRDEAGRSDSFFARVSFVDFDDLKREAARVAVEGLFDNKGIAKVVHEITIMAIAYGFQAEKQKMKYAAVEAALDAVIKEHSVGKVSDETADAFFGEVLKIEEPIVAIEYARKALTGHKIHFSTKVPNFIAFTQHYMTMLVDA